MNRRRLAAGALVVPLCLALLAVGRGAWTHGDCPAEIDREPGSRPRSAMDRSVPVRVGSPSQVPSAVPVCREPGLGWSLSLPHVLFASGEWRLQDDALAELDELARFLARHPQRHVAIEGHADPVGRAEDNQALSWRRVESVRAHLVGRGIDAARIAVSAQGADLPVADNASLAGRRQNRRVAVTVFERDESAIAQEVR